MVAVVTEVTGVLGVVGVVTTVVAGVVLAASGQQTPINLPWMMQMLVRNLKKSKNSGMRQWWK